MGSGQYVRRFPYGMMSIVHRPDDRDERGPSPERAEPAGPTPDQQRRRTLAKVVVALIILVLFILFVTQNTDPTTVDFVFVEVRTSLVWVFLGCALIGALVAYLMGRGGRRASRKYIRELERRLEER